MADTDPTKITMREAADAYNAKGGGKLTKFTAKGSLFKDYGNMSYVDFFTQDEDGVSPYSSFMEGKTPKQKKALDNEIRLLGRDIRAAIARQDPQSNILSFLPGFDSDDEQTRIIMGEVINVGKDTEIATLTKNEQGWKEVFEFLDKAEAEGGNRQTVAAALFVNLYTGYRTGAIAKLSGSEYDVDEGVIEITPQTKANPNAPKRAGAQKLGKRGDAVPQDMPLSEQVHAKLQEVLARNAKDPEIKAYIEAEVKAGRPAPIFVLKDTDRSGKTVLRGLTSNDMSTMLRDIKTTQPLFRDNFKPKQEGLFYGFFPYDKDGNLMPEYMSENYNPVKGKFGAALLRNAFANVSRYRLQQPGQMRDFLQGRSSTSGAETQDKTARSGYTPRPRGEFFPEERNAVQAIANWFDGVRGKTGYLADEFNPETDRVTSATYQIPGFFDAPKPPPAADAPAAKTVTLNDMFGMLGDSDAPTDEPPAKPTTLKSSMLAGAATGTLTALGVLGLVSDPEGMMIETGAGEGAQLLARRAMRFLAPRLSPVGPAAAVSEVAAQVAGPTEIGAQSPDDESRLAYEDREAQRVAAERAVLDDPYFNVSPNVYYDDATGQYIDINTGKPRVTRETVLQMIQDQRKADPRPTAPADISTMELSMQQGAEGFDQDALAFLQSQNMTGERNEPQYG